MHFYMYGVRLCIVHYNLQPYLSYTFIVRYIHLCLTCFCTYTKCFIPIVLLSQYQSRYNYILKYVSIQNNTFCILKLVSIQIQPSVFKYVSIQMQHFLYSQVSFNQYTTFSIFVSINQSRYNSPCILEYVSIQIQLALKLCLSTETQ